MLPVVQEPPPSLAPARMGPALHASTCQTEGTLPCPHKFHVWVSLRVHRSKGPAGQGLAAAVAQQLSDAVGRASSACFQVARAGGLKMLELINADHGQLRSVQGCITRWLAVIKVLDWPRSGTPAGCGAGLPGGAASRAFAGAAGSGCAPLCASLA